MRFGQYCPSTEVNFAGSLFMPKVSAKLESGGQTFSADSEENVYAIPAIGLSIPILSKGEQNLRFGLAAYGVTGLGVDYRGAAFDQMINLPTPPGGQAPLIAGEHTSLQIMKFAPLAGLPAEQQMVLRRGSAP